MNDFETVRESIYGPGSKRGLAALDRIEAEVERLRAALEEVDIPNSNAWARHIARAALAKEEASA